MSQGLSTLSQYFQVYYTTSELELQKTSFCYKSFTIKKGGPLGPVEGASAPVVPPSLRACTLTNPSTSFWNGVACSFNSVFGIQ